MNGPATMYSNEYESGESDSELDEDSDEEPVPFYVQSKYTTREQKLQVAFRNGKLGIRLAPLCSGFGAAFDGWIDPISRNEEFKEEANNQALLEVGDRLASFDNQDLLEAEFSEIRDILLDSTNVKDPDQFRRRNLIFLKPAKKRFIRVSEDCNDLSVWFHPINKFFYGAAFSGSIKTQSEEKQLTVPDFADVETNSSVISVNQRSVAGLSFEHVLDCIKETKRPFEIAFGEYTEGTITSTLVSTEDILKRDIYPSDTLLKTNGISFGEKYVDSFFEAIFEGDRDTFVSRIKTGLSLNVLDSRGRTPFLASLGNKDTWFAQVLLAEGSDINATDANGNGALHIACSVEYSSKLLKLLVTNGADIRKKDSMGCTALHRAVMNGKRECVNVLLELIPKSERKDYINIPDTKWGWTALHYVSSNGREDIAKILLVNGADPHSLSLSKEIALNIARSLNHKEVAGLIHETIMDEPLHCVWPMGGEWVKGNNGPEIVWRYNPEETKTTELCKRQERMEKVLGIRGVIEVGNHDIKEEKEFVLDVSSEEIDQEKQGCIWIGSRDALNAVWMERKGIEAVLFLGNKENSEKDDWLKTNFKSKYMYLQISCNSGEDGWRSFLQNLPSGIQFMHENFHKKKRRLLVVSDQRKTLSLCRPVSMVAAMLVTKFKILLSTALDTMNKNCYFYKYKHALTKAEYLRIRQKFDSHLKQFPLLIADTNTKPGDISNSNLPWVPGKRRCEITDPVYDEGLRNLEMTTQQRRLKNMRKKSIKFQKEFITLLEN